MTQSIIPKYQIITDGSNLYTLSFLPYSLVNQEKFIKLEYRETPENNGV